MEFYAMRKNTGYLVHALDRDDVEEIKNKRLFYGMPLCDKYKRSKGKYVSMSSGSLMRKTNEVASFDAVTFGEMLDGNKKTCLVCAMLYKSFVQNNLSQDALGKLFVHKIDVQRWGLCTLFVNKNYETVEGFAALSNKASAKELKKILKLVEEKKYPLEWAEQLVLSK